MPPKAAAAAAKPVKKPVKAPTVANPLFPSREKSNRVGGDLRPKGRDLSRFVRWPRYVRLQRQKKILLQRLKTPPAINQFSRTLDKNAATETLKLLEKYRPETAIAKQERRDAAAAAEAKSGVKEVKTGPAPAQLKFGLKHVTTLIEQKKAKVVLIAHDVNPIELVVWLPALCRKMDVPFAIIKGRSRLGTLTHQKNCAVVALTKVNKEDDAKLKSLQESFRAQFNDNVEKHWGGGVMGLKTKAKLEKRQKAIDIENAKKALTRAK